MRRHTALSRHQNARLPDSMADVRGYEVRTRDTNEKVGKIDDLVFTTDGELRYLGVDVGGWFSSKHILLPVGAAQLDREKDVVWVPGMTREQVTALPDYDASTTDISVEYEERVRQPYAPQVPDRDLYDQARFYAERGGPAAAAARMILSEEELHVGKRRVQHEVPVRKTVETEHVHQTVPVVREEVTIERRPVSSDRVAAGHVEITEDEIRIPVMAEEPVVQKRVVTAEEAIVRKEVRTENHIVEADLRRERLQVDRDVAGVRNRPGARDTEAGLSGAADRATDSGPLDRLADRADDLKDRVDGNPASRPGPDPTDRRL